MGNVTRVWAALVGCLALILVSVGCNQNRNVTVTGTVLRDGKPIALSPTGVIQVTLMPDIDPNEQYNTYVGRCDATGKFEVLEVPPGRYKIGIEQLDPTPQNDKLNATFSYSNAKFNREIDGKTPLTIDLAKPGS
jgi:hypothetical protein